MTALTAALDYLRRGWQPIPVPHRSKKPALKGWPDLRLSAADFGRHFDGQPSNMGVLLGEPSAAGWWTWTSTALRRYGLPRHFCRRAGVASGGRPSADRIGFTW